MRNINLLFTFHRDLIADFFQMEIVVEWVQV
jgi:hypothetical protein